MPEYAMLRCPVGHVINPRLHGRNCPTCGLPADSSAKKGVVDARTALEIESELLNVRINPVVGWLICVGGPRSGLSYQLYDGKNFIGRGDDQTVQIHGDGTVSLRNHACIAYDSWNRTFTLLPGDSDGLVFFRGECVHKPERLADLSRIVVGRTELVFKPLCDNRFSWDVPQKPSKGSESGFAVSGA